MWSTVVENGAGVYAEPPLPMLQALRHWLEADGQQLAQAARRARQLGRPRAAYDIAERVLEFARQGPARLSRLKRLRILLPQVSALLDRFSVKWRD